MILSNYNQTNANKLTKFSFPEVSEPFPYKILWLRSIATASKPKGISKNPHRHSFFEVHYILDGSTEYRDESGNLWTVSAGEGILFAPSTMHALTFCSENMVKLSLTFSCDTKNPPFDTLCKNGTFTFCIDEKMKALFETVLEEVELRNLFSSKLIQNCIFELICRLLRSATPAEENSIVSLPENDTRITSAKQFIKDNPNRFLTCNEVAQYCHFNVKYLNRIFKKSTGMTLLSYIHKQKVMQIQELLEYSDFSLEEISRRLGFRNEYYFNSFFNRYGGMTPKLYRILTRKSLL